MQLRVFGWINDDNVLRTEEVVNDPLHSRRKKEKEEGRKKERGRKQASKKLWPVISLCSLWSQGFAHAVPSARNYNHSTHPLPELPIFFRSQVIIPSGKVFNDLPDKATSCYYDRS